MEFLHDVPDVLYKYRDYSDSYHKDLLFKRELYFASIEQFNDPFDGGIPFRYNPEELTEANIFLKYLEITKKEHPEWTEKQIHNECYEYQRRGFFYDENYMEDFDNYNRENMKNSFGIVSLSKEKNNFLMWSHYSKSHRGFCIGFDKFGLFKDTQAEFGHMLYEEELPYIGIKEDVVPFFTKQIGIKSKLWSYEKEYRLTKVDAAKKVIKLKKNTIVELIFGCKMEHSQKMEILDFVKVEYPHIHVYENKLSKSKFDIEISQIF